MILEKTGKIRDGLYSIGNQWIPTFLLMSDPPVLFDAGMTIGGPLYLRDLERYLGDPHRLGYVFLTHSHFDHCGAAPYLRRNIPGVKVAASRLAKENLNKPNAIKLIQRLSQNIETLFPEYAVHNDISFDFFEIDVPLEDADECKFGGDWTVQVMATPGHTRDALSYYIPELRALIPGEATGVLDAHYDVQSEFLSSYNEYVASHEKLSTLDVDMVLLPHHHILIDNAARRHIEKSLHSAKEFKNRIETYLDRFKGDRDAVVNAILRADFEEKQLVLQDRQSYLVNLKAKVNVVAEKR